MRASSALFWLCVLAVAYVGCGQKTGIPSLNLETSTRVAADDALVQFSLLAALAADDYTGVATLGEVLACGDFGVGTFDRLDGEMIVLNGTIYQARSDGTVRKADLDGTTPFASVTFFEEDGHIDDFAAATLEHVDQQLDRQLPRRNWPYAIRIDGEFAEITVRTVPAQSPPFRPLVEVVKEQPTWEHYNIRGTLIGTRCPNWMGTLNVSGYHWHFLSNDRTIGGHVLQCNLQKGEVSYDECSSILIRLPNSEAFEEFDQNAVTQEDVDKIERERTPK